MKASLLLIALALPGCALETYPDLESSSDAVPAAIVCLGAPAVGADVVCESAKTARCARIYECSEGRHFGDVPGPEDLNACIAELVRGGFKCPLAEGETVCKYAAGDCIEAIRAQPCPDRSLPFLCQAARP